MQTSVHQRTKLFHSSQKLSDNSTTHTLLDPPVLTFQSDAAAVAGLFSLPPQPLNTTSTMNWHTVPSAEIHQTFSIKYPKCTMCAEGSNFLNLRFLEDISVCMHVHY